MSLKLLRKKLAKPEPSWQLCLLGLLGGTLASVFIILFRLSIESLQLLYLENIDDYTTLSEIQRFITPVIAVGLILGIAWLLGFKYTRMGIPFVIHRLKVAYGSIPFKNTLTQFFGGIFALAGGFSVGREGPAVHIGAASSSFLGSKLALPQNSIRTLCACGIAAGISASFNTPLAAVIFVMEVILREYKLHIFIPVILASIVGSMMTNAVFGSFHEFEFFAYIVIDFWHYPLLIVLGIFLGFLAKAFNSSLIYTIKLADNIHMAKRLFIAAILMGLIGVLVPQAMGPGLSAIDLIHGENVPILLLLSLLVAKFVATVAILGLGIPGGVIGPTLGIGAVAGAFIAFFVSLIFPELSFAGDYALLGMAGMLAATLNAPLAALLTVIELSNKLEIALPAMVVITSAFLTSSQFLKNRSIFLQQLELQQLPYQVSPVESVLQKHGVLSHMEEDYTLLNNADNELIKHTWATQTTHQPIIVQSGDEEFKLVQIDFNSYPLEGEDGAIKTTLMPAIDSQATLSEAYFALYEKREGAVFIYHKSKKKIIGLLAFDKIRLILTKGNI